VSAGLGNNDSSRAPGKGGVTSGRAAARKGIDQLPPPTAAHAQAVDKGIRSGRRGKGADEGWTASRERERDSDGLAPASVSTEWDS